VGRSLKVFVKILSLLVIVVFIASMATPMAFAKSTNTSTKYYGPSLNGKQLGYLSSNYPITFSVFLLPRNYNYLMFVAQQVANKQMKPLSRSQVLKMFAPTQQQFDSIVNYLESMGFRVVYKSPDRLSVMVQGTVGQVQKLFKVRIALYKNSKGKVYYAPAGRPVIPSQLSSALIFGLTNITSFRAPHIVSGIIKDKYFGLSHAKGYKLLKKLSPKFGNKQYASAALYYTPADFEGAYNVTNLMEYSKGTSIAIIDAYGDPLIYQDVAFFDELFGLPMANLTLIPIGPYHPSLGMYTGWDVETALDVEAAQSMAPYAHIYLLIASNAGDALFEAIDYVVSTKLANTVSMSWGEPENLMALTGFYTSNPMYVSYGYALGYAYADYYFALGSAEGISFFSSSGDEGAYDYTPLLYGAVSFPPSSPFVTGVGGTTLFVNVTSGQLAYLNSMATYGYENAWSVSPLYGVEVASTGGYSSIFPKPWYQYGVVSGNYRATPDVAADANPYTGFVEVVEGTLMVIGGTSLSSPLWAGMTADIDGYLNTSLGLLNPILYSIYKNQTLYSKAFHEITFGYNGYYYAKKGYNLVTGLGSPNVGFLANAIKDVLSSKHLEISVMTAEPNSTYPWYNYNTTFSIISRITYQNGTTVKTGNFSAYIYTTSGLLDVVPLTFNGTYWVGSYHIKANNPPNTWTILVKGSSQGIKGVGATDIDVGVGLAIISPPTPMPYPYGSSLPLNYPFPVYVYATLPNGKPASNLTLTAYLIHHNKVYYATQLQEKGNGTYIGYMELPYPAPQGAYILLVNSTVGSVYSYEYFGQSIISAFVLTPVNDGLPSVSPGESVILMAQVINPTGYGMYTSSIVANIYNSSKQLVAQVPLMPTASGIQVGFYTIPSNMKPGFYNVVFVSYDNSELGPLYGYYNQSFYVAPSSLYSMVRSIHVAYEGQNVIVTANITYPNGTEVKYGMFVATLIPDQQYSNLLLMSFTIGIPLQYVPSMNEWMGILSLPSLGSPGFFTGESVSQLSGPWSITISGESANGYDVISMPYNVYVQPYTYIGSAKISQETLQTLPMGTVFGNSIVGIYSENLVVTNANITIENSEISNLTIENSNVTILNSEVRTITSYNSNINVMNSKVGPSLVGITLINSSANVANTLFQSVKYAFHQVNSVVQISGLSEYNVSKLSLTTPPKLISISPSTITKPINYITVSIEGSGLKPVKVLVDNVPVTFTYTSSKSMLYVKIPFNSTSLPDGAYTITIEVSNGLTYYIKAQVFNTYHIEYQSGVIAANKKLATQNIQNIYNKIESQLLSNVTMLNNKISKLSGTLSMEYAAVKRSISTVNSTLSSSISTLSGKISSLSSTLSSDVKALNGKISTVNSTLSSSISTLSGKISSLSSTLSSDVKALNGKISTVNSTLSSSISTVNSTAIKAKSVGDTSLPLGISGTILGIIGIIIAAIAIGLLRRRVK